MFINRSTNVQKFGNLKPLLRTKTVECVTALLSNKQQNRQSSSNDGDRINDENGGFENHTTATSSATKNERTEVKQQQNLSTVQQSTTTNNKNNAKSKMFIEVNLFGPKDSRLNLPGNVGFAPQYLVNPKPKKAKKQIEKEFKLILDHNPSTDECLTTTIEYKLNNYETNEDRQNRVIENAIYNHKDEQSLEYNQKKFKSLFFIKVYKSTELVLNDIKSIFPKDLIFEKDFVLITVYKNPFSKITNLNLKDEFVNLANSISDSLNKNGCWTNFLAPDQKRSYSDFITCLNMNGDERFINYGIEVEEHANCKLINHVNSAKLFMGTVFTNAKFESVELNRVLSHLTSF